MTIVTYLDNGKVSINGTEYELPNPLTSIRGISEDMLLVKFRGYTYADAFREGCRLLGGRVESDIEVMEKELNSTEKEYAALTMKLADLRERVGAYKDAESTKEQDVTTSLENIVTEFERLTMAAGFHKKNNVLNYLVTLSGFDIKTIHDIYKAATPEGSITPEAKLVGAEVRKAFVY